MTIFFRNPAEETRNAFWAPKNSKLERASKLSRFRQPLHKGLPISPSLYPVNASPAKPRAGPTPSMAHWMDQAAKSATVWLTFLCTWDAVVRVKLSCTFKVFGLDAPKLYRGNTQNGFLNEDEIQKHFACDVPV